MKKQEVEELIDEINITINLGEGKYSPNLSRIITNLLREAKTDGNK